MKIADAALASQNATASSHKPEWQPMHTTTATSSSSSSSSSSSAWWANVGVQTTQFLDTAAAVFAERRRLVLSVAGTLLFLVVAFNLSAPVQSSGTIAGGSTGGGDLPTNLRRRIQATRLKALRKGKLGTSLCTPRCLDVPPTHPPTHPFIPLLLSQIKAWAAPAP